jgi:hypothetical protein
VTFAAMRATSRIAWRTARRSPMRSALVVATVALPVMFVTALGTIARTVFSSPQEAAAWEAISLIAGVLGLFVTGLIAAAAFVVGARRQLRELGLLGAVGGQPRHVVAAVLLAGTSLGAIGSAVGVVLGIVATHLIHGRLDELVNHPVGPIAVNFNALFGAGITGVVASTLAALAPARSAAKVSTVDALAGRSGPPRPPGRVGLLGLVILIGGAVMTGFGLRTDDDLVLAAGLMAMLGGFLLSIPLLVALLGRIASPLPLSLRLASRDAARHGRRTGAAVAAAAIALSVPIAASTYTLSKDAHERNARRLGPNELVVGDLPVARGLFGGEEELLEHLRREFAGATIVPIDEAVARDRGLEDSEATYLLTAPRPFAADDLESARRIAAKYRGFYVAGDEDPLPRYALGRSVATAASLPLAMCVVAVAVALVAAETRRSRTMLVAIGGDPMSYRKVLAATALVLGVTAAVLAIPIGLVPMIVVWVVEGQQVGFPFVIPWAVIGFTLFVVPLVGGLLTGAVARSPRLGSLLRAT